MTTRNDEAAYADFQDNVEAVRKKRAWPAIAWPEFNADHLEIAKTQASAAPLPPSPPSAQPKPAPTAISPAHVQSMLKDAYATIAAEKQSKVDADWAEIADRHNKSTSLEPRSLSQRDRRLDAPATASPRWPSAAEADASWAAIAAKTNQEMNLKPRNVAQRPGA